MRNLILLNEAVNQCMNLAIICNRVSLYGDEAVDVEAESTYRDLLIDSLVSMMAIVELVGQEYEVDKENLFPVFEGRLKELQAAVSIISADQPNSSSQSSDESS